MCRSDKDAIFYQNYSQKTACNVSCSLSPLLLVVASLCNVVMYFSQKKKQREQERERETEREWMRTGVDLIIL